MKVLKLNRLDAHDRMLHFTKQSFDIGECCQNLIDIEPFGKRPFYIFAHTRTDDDGVTKRLIWQPRLLKPQVETNSMLFKGYPGTDNVKIIWMIPEEGMWPQFKPGLVTESNTIWNSIHDYKFNKKELEAPEKDDPTEEEARQIYIEIYKELLRKKKLMQKIVGESSTSKEEPASDPSQSEPSQQDS